MGITGDSTDVTTYFTLRLTATGVEATGLDVTTFDLQYVRSGVAPSAKVDATALAATDSAHGDNKAIEIDATDQPGLYRVDWPDAPFASGVKEVILTVKAATVFTEHLRVVIDLPVNVAKVIGTAPTESAAGRLAAGITKFFNVAAPTGTLNSLPDAVAGAVNGLLISGSNLGTTTFAALTVTGAFNVTGGVTFSSATGNAFVCTAAGNGNGFIVTGSGSGSGARFQGGASGSGIRGLGGSTSGNGMYLEGVAANQGAFVMVVAGAGNAHAMSATGSGTGAGLYLASADGVGLNAASGISMTTLTVSGAFAVGTNNLPWNAEWDAEVQSECNDALVAYSVVTTSQFNSLAVNTRANWNVPMEIENPDASTQIFKIRLHLFDVEGNMEAPDSTPTVALTNAAGTDRSSRLSAASNPSTGVYTWDYTATAGDTEEQLVWVFTVVEGGLTRVYPATSYVVEESAYRFSSTDRANLLAILADTDSLDTTKITTARAAVLSDLIDGGRLDLLIDAILDDTGTTGVVITAGSKTGYSLSASGLDPVLVESSITAGSGLTDDAGTQLTSINARQALATILSASAAVLAGAATPNVTIKQAAKPAGNTRIDATVDSSGNRSAVTLKVPT